MRSLPLISVIINVKNGERFLSDSIESVLAQTFNDFELIVFDNRSSDSSRDIALKYSLRDSRVRLISAKVTSDLYAARNKALKYAKAEFVAFLDSDDMWVSAKLKDSYEAIRTSDACFCYTNFMILDEFSKTSRVAYRSALPRGHLKPSFFWTYPVCFSTILFKKSCLVARTGPFDENSNHLGDVKLVAEIAKNCQATSINTPLTLYRLHESSLSFSDLENKRRETNNWIKQIGEGKKKDVYAYHALLSVQIDLALSNKTGKLLVLITSVRLLFSRRYGFAILEKARWKLINLAQGCF